ncbi:MAG TPA: hypothetical protein PKW33_03645 [Anaerolineaceae bacterium]|nr:hypothetical protein [Anaerolineaceae bacterium]HPN50656.1 hypothetical protein [Anaerolineaceae bacterium]
MALLFFTPVGSQCPDSDQVSTHIISFFIADHAKPDGQRNIQKLEKACCLPPGCSNECNFMTVQVGQCAGKMFEVV